jgi:hypothetical protein
VIMSPYTASQGCNPRRAALLCSALAASLCARRKPKPPPAPHCNAVHSSSTHTHAWQRFTRINLQNLQTRKQWPRPHYGDEKMWLRIFKTARLRPRNIDFLDCDVLWGNKSSKNYVLLGHSTGCMLHATLGVANY